jgi:pantoate--beta-alanine ligase
MTDVVTNAREAFSRCEQLRRSGHRIGFVPTMGALHEGHISLVRAAEDHGATKSVMSIFVNPLQFGPTEDFSRYPRTFEADIAKATAAGVDFVYAPAPASMYPPGFETHVEVEQVTRRFEGQFRPTHFRGVTTVVLKLFMAIGPCVAVFGRKDYQQWKTLERMTLDLDLPIEVVGAPILRDADGLAMSSRNRYLDQTARARALAIVRGLRAAFDAHGAGLRSPSALAALVRKEVERDFDRIDYVESAAPDSLGELDGDTNEQVLLVAAHLGTTRLIDNLCLGRDSRP